MQCKFTEEALQVQNTKKSLRLSNNYSIQCFVKKISFLQLVLIRPFLTNQNSLKVPKVGRPTYKKTFYKTLGLV